MRLPQNVSAVDVANNIVIAASTNAKLLECSVASLLQCSVTAASYGLSLGGPIKHVAIVPYKQTATLIPTYQGLMELARRHRHVDAVIVEHVYQGDEYEYRGPNQLPVHEPSDSEDRRRQHLTHVYVVVYWHGGRVLCRQWTRADCLHQRNTYSQNWKNYQKTDNPWHEENTSFPIMCGKSLLRYMVNRGEIPLAKEYADMIQRDEAVAGEVVSSRTMDDDYSTPPQRPDLTGLVDEPADEPETVEQTENAWKEIFLKALAAQTKPNDVREVYASIREIADKNPDDGCWAEDEMKRRLKELGAK